MAENGAMTVVQTRNRSKQASNRKRYAEEGRTPQLMNQLSPSVRSRVMNSELLLAERLRGPASVLDGA